MKPNILLRATLRQPVRAALMWLLVALVSFAFVANLTEFIVVERETARLGGFYQTIGTLQGREANITAGAELLAESRYIAFLEQRRVVSGVMRDYHNADASTRNRFDRLHAIHSAVLYGTVLTIGARYNTTSRQSMETGSPARWFYIVTVQVRDRIAGFPEYTPDVRPITVYVPIETHEATPLRVGQQYLMRVCFFPYNETTTRIPIMNIAGQPSVTGPYFLLPLYLGSAEIRHWWLSATLAGTAWGPPRTLPIPQVPFVPVEPGAYIDLNTPEWAALREDLEILGANQRSMAVIGTQDMTAMPTVWAGIRRITLTQGRWLTAEDNAEARRVTVIPAQLARLRGIRLGDTIAMTLRDNQTYWSLRPNPIEQQRGILAAFWDYHGYITRDQHGFWRDFPTVEEEYTVVGIYRDYRDYGAEFGDMSQIVMYVPDSTIPEAFGGFSRWGTRHDLFSFTLRSHQDMDAFMAENREALAELRLNISFIDNNAEAFWNIIDPLRQSKRVSVVVYTLLLLLALALTSFLYLRQRQKEYAVMRALGVPKRSAIRQMLTPIGWIGLLGIAAGGIPAWRYALGQAAEALARLYQPWRRGEAIAHGEFVPISTVWLMLLCAAVFALLIGMVLAGAVRLSQKSVLAMLQGGAAARRHHPPGCAGTPPIEGNEDAQTQFPSTGGVARSAGVVSPVLHYPRNNPAALHVLSFAFRHIRRTPLKTILTAATAILFVVALGWFTRLMARNEADIGRLYDMARIEAEAVSAESGVNAVALYKRGVDAILEGRHFQHAAVTTYHSWGIRTHGGGAAFELRLRATNHPDQAVDPFWQGVAIQYAPGYGNRLFTERDTQWPGGAPVVVHADLLERLGLSLGERAELFNTATGSATGITIAGTYRLRGESEDQPGSVNATVLVPLAFIDSPRAGAWYIPPTVGIDRTHWNAWFAAAEFVIHPAFNRDLNAATRQIDTILARPFAGPEPMRLAVYDEELRLVIAPMEGLLSLLTMLYPVLLAVSVLIAAGLALLMAMQSTKNAALLRILGTTKRRVSVMLCVEQGLVCAAGLAVGLAAVFLLFGGDTAQPLAAAGLYLGGALIGSIFAAWRITAKKPLELLQVKE
jgi:hypothetical protein